MSKLGVWEVGRREGRGNRWHYPFKPSVPEGFEQRVKREILAFSVAQRGRSQREEPIVRAIVRLHEPGGSTVGFRATSVVC